MATRYAYLLAYNDAFGDRDSVKQFLDGRPEILNWTYVLPYSFFVVSELSAKDLTQVLHEHRATRNGLARFIVIDVDTDKSGWLPRKTWTFMNHPRAAGEKP